MNHTRSYRLTVFLLAALIASSTINAQAWGMRRSPQLTPVDLLQAQAFISPIVIAFSSRSFHKAVAITVLSSILTGIHPMIAQEPSPDLDENDQETISQLNKWMYSVRPGHLATNKFRNDGKTVAVIQTVISIVMVDANEEPARREALNVLQTFLLAGILPDNNPQIISTLHALIDHVSSQPNATDRILAESIREELKILLDVQKVGPFSSENMKAMMDQFINVNSDRRLIINEIWYAIENNPTHRKEASDLISNNHEFRDALLKFILTAPLDDAQRAEDVARHLRGSELAEMVNAILGQIISDPLVASKPIGILLVRLTDSREGNLILIQRLESLTNERHVFVSAVSTILRALYYHVDSLPSLSSENNGQQIVTSALLKLLQLGMFDEVEKGLPVLMSKYPSDTATSILEFMLAKIATTENTPAAALSLKAEILTAIRALTRPHPLQSSPSFLQTAA